MCQENQIEKVNQLKGLCSLTALSQFIENLFNSTLFLPTGLWMSKGKFLLVVTSHNIDFFFFWFLLELSLGIQKILDLSLLSSTLFRIGRSSSWRGCRLLLLSPKMPRHQLSNTASAVFLQYDQNKGRITRGKDRFFFFINWAENHSN